jgi:hypothetical protein
VSEIRWNEEFEMIFEMKVGPQALSDGVVAAVRGDKTGAQVITAAHATYAEAVLRGGVMEACTGVAGVAPGTVLSTTPPFALWNPPSSGRNLIVMKATLGYVSGTFGGGSILFGYVPSQTTVPSGGTELVPANAMLGFPRGVGRVFQGSTLVSVPLVLRPSFVMGAWVGTTPTPPSNELDIVDGGIVVAQNTVLVMQGLAGAGTTPLAMFAITWEEVPA